MSRVALVTGGTRGIGAAISITLSKAGYNVAANYRSNDAAAKAFASSTGIHVFSWNVADGRDCRRGVSQVQAELGDISVLVNNAGVTRDRAFHKMSDEDWDSVIDINLGSAFRMTRAVIEPMRAQRYGRIINISSINGQKGQPGQANYSATKAGLYGLTKALALEYARAGITINAVAPGYIDTDMLRAASEANIEWMRGQVPMGRLGTPEEIAYCVEFLASERAGYITGATITVNGGAYIA